MSSDEDAWQIGLDDSYKGGNPGQFGFSIAGIRVQQGSLMTLPSPGVTAVVGGNNVGKSTLLRQLVGWVRGDPKSGPEDPPILSDVELSMGGTTRPRAMAGPQF